VNLDTLIRRWAREIVAVVLSAMTFVESNFFCPPGPEASSQRTIGAGMPKATAGIGILACLESDIIFCHLKIFLGAKVASNSRAQVSFLPVGLPA
jgi:hypothetical protein